MFVLLLTCALLIILPILAEQYRRTPVSSKIDPPAALEATRLKISVISSNLDGGSDEQDVGSASRVGTLNMKGEEPYRRKPWDPPFPQSPTIPLSPSFELRAQQQPRQENAHPLSWLPYLGAPSHSSSPQQSSSHIQLDNSTCPPLEPSHSPKKHETSQRRWPILRLAMFAMAVIIFMFMYAILIAHCLAWFVVYKTESRLGALHKSVLRGGNMRICLCAP